MSDYEMPPKSEFYRLTAQINVSPPLTDDVIGPGPILVGVFDETGEYRSSRLQPEDDDLPSCPGVKVVVRSHTDNVDDLRERWRAAAQS